MFGNFFQRVKNLVTGGGWQTDEEERRKEQQRQQQQQQQRQNAQRSSAPQPGTVVQPQQNNITDFLSNSLQPRGGGLFEMLEKAQPEQKPPQQKPDVRQELERRTQENMDKAMRDATQGQNWLQRNLLNRGSNERNAEILARSRARAQFHEEHGYGQKDARDFGAETLRKANENTNTGASNWVAPILSAGRVGTGIVEGAAGLYDWLTPGHGQNRLTKAANRKAQEIDTLAQDMGIDTAYKVTNVPLEIGSYFIPSVGLSKAGRVGGFFSRLGDDIATRVGTSSFGRRLLGRSAQEFFDPVNMSKDVQLTGRYTGQDSARGEAITPQMMLENLGMSILGAGVPGAVRALRKVDVHGEPTNISVSRGPTEAPAPGELDFGISSSNPAYEGIESLQAAPDLNTPAYQRGVPETVGEAQLQADRGIYNAPDTLFDADARMLERPPEVPDPLDTPAFMRRNPEVLDAANARLAQANNLVEMLQKAPSEQELRFNQRQQMADLPTQRQRDAQSELFQLQKANRDETALARALGERRAAQREVGEIEKAIRAGEDPALTSPAQEIPQPAPTAVDTTPAPVAAQTATDIDTSVPVETPVQGVEVTPDAPVPTPDIAPESQAPTPATRRVQTAEVIDSGPSAKTGEIGKSQAKVARGREYEKVSRETAQEAGARRAANTSYEEFTRKHRGRGVLSLEESETARALADRYKRGTPERKELLNMAGDPVTKAAQVMSVQDRVIRQTSSPKALTDRFERRLYSSLDDDVKFSDSDFKTIEKRNEEFVAARDNRDAAVEAFNSDPSDANLNNVVEAFKKVEEADRAAKFEEYQIANRLGKGNKNPKAKELIDKLGKEAGVYQMDWVDSSMLSSTRTMLNNFLNTYGIGAEERLFGKIGARLASKITGEIIGGGSRAGRKLGQKLGDANLRRDVRLRQQAEGNKLVKSYKNIVTTGNTLGERNIEGATFSGVFDHYTQSLKKQGFKGDELKRRALVNSLLDPENVVDTYRDPILAANALGARTLTKTPKLESMAVHALTRGSDNKAVKTAAKLLVRTTLGFPTVVWRSMVEGGKRAMFGLPTLGRFGAAMKAGEKADAAMHFKNFIKEAGSGATMGVVGATLAANDMLSGSYPADKDERARWEREGIKENSIKLGGHWYELPPLLGSLALPFMAGANAYQNITSGEHDNLIETAWGTATDSFRTAIDTSPVSSINESLNIITDWQRGRDVSAALIRKASSAARGLTPAGSFMNQVAKMFDPNANDTQRESAAEEFVARLMDGIPGLANTLDDKLVDGNTIKNPHPIARLFGATGREQEAGVQKTQQIEAQVEGAIKELQDYGALTDPIRNILEDEHKSLFDKARDGKKLSESEAKTLMDKMVKGVTQTEDTRFLEDGDYDSNLAVLKVKRAILEADPTTRRETLEDYDRQIKRGEVYKKLKTPYKDIKNYKDYSLTEWRNLGDPGHEDYNPDLYQKLWDLDVAMTEAGVSRRPGDPTKQKYYAKKSGSGGGRGGGRGGSRSNTVGSPGALAKIDFGKLRAEQTGTPRVPVITKLKPGELKKKRKITVSRS